MAMVVAVVVGAFHATLKVLFSSLTCCAIYVALPCWAFFAATVVFSSTIYTEIGSIINFHTQHRTKHKKRTRMRLCNAYYEFLMHSITKAQARLKEEERERKREREISAWLCWIIQCWVLFNRFLHQANAGGWMCEMMKGNVWACDRST